MLKPPISCGLNILNKGVLREFQLFQLPFLGGCRLGGTFKLRIDFDADEQQLSVRRVNETKHMKLDYAHSEQSVCTQQLSNIIKLSNNLTTRRRTTGGGGHMKQSVLVTDSMQ